MYAFGKTEVVILIQILDFTLAVWLHNSWGCDLRIFVADSRQSIFGFHRWQEIEIVQNVALSLGFLNAFTRQNLLKTPKQQQQKIRCEIFKKKGLYGVWSSKFWWIGFGFSMLVFFLSEQKKMHKKYSALLLRVFFFSLSPFKCRKLTFCREKKEKVECNHIEPRFCSGEFRQLL